MHSTPFYGKKGKPNAINTAERTQSIAENPLKKRCVDEEEQNEGTSAVETPSVEEFGKEEEGEGTSALDTPSVEEFGKEEERRRNFCIGYSICGGICQGSAHRRNYCNGKSLRGGIFLMKKEKGRKALQ